MPLPVITVAQMRDWEQATWVSGQTEGEVIRRVGQRVGQRALDLTAARDRILILAGKGNNGEDARCAAPLLTDRHVELMDVTNPADDCATLENLLSKRPDLIIDGLFGIGLNRPLDTAWVKFIERINEQRCPVLAVDLPSGLNADTGDHYGACVVAAETLTVGTVKRGLLRDRSWTVTGRIEIASDVGLIPCPQTSDLQWVLPEDFRGYPPPRSAAAHKGTFGHLAIVAGSLGYHGAAVLAARAAQRAQPGLITLHALETVYPVIAPQLQAVMVRPWPEDATLPGTWSAILAGPGLAGSEVPDALKTRIRHLWRDSDLPVIIDASALDWLPMEQAPQKAIRVITPHPGEAARLLRTTTQKVQENRVAAVRQISRQFSNAWVVLKGHQTLIGRSTGEIHVNSSGNPHLAQGGSGDALCGFIGGLLAQPGLQADPGLALRYAVWQHGAAADCLQSNSPGWVIEDLVAALGSVTRLPRR